AATRALDGHLSTGEVLVLLAYAGSLYGPVSGLSGIYGDVQAAAAGAERVFEVLDLPHPPEDATALAPAPRATGVVRFDGVSFGYSTDHRVLHDIGFAAKPGQLVALVGPTGAGKSTIVSLPVRLYDPDHGRGLLDGAER